MQSFSKDKGDVVLGVCWPLGLLVALLAVRQGAVRELGQGKSTRVAKTSALHHNFGEKNRVILFLSEV